MQAIGYGHTVIPVNLSFAYLDSILLIFPHVFTVSVASADTSRLAAVGQEEDAIEDYQVIIVIK